jgi:hypothetical protein
MVDMNRISREAVLALQEVPDGDDTTDDDVAGHDSTSSLAYCVSPD